MDVLDAYDGFSEAVILGVTEDSNRLRCTCVTGAQRLCLRN